MKFPWTLIKKLKLSRWNFPQNQYDSGQSWKFALRKLVFNLSGYNKYGLYTHDIMYYDTPAMYEALRRLPEDVLDARNFRIMRASQLGFLKIHLPKEKWVTYEEDLKYRYLTPYLDEVETEQAEIKEFDYTDYKDND